MLCSRIGTISPEAKLHVTETIKAKKIVADGAVFTGMILMWSGAANQIPTGWVLCNGQNRTPDLRNRFLVGAGDKYSVGNTGGADSVTLSVDQMPSHTHDITDNGHKHTTNIYSQTGRSDNANDRNVRVPDNVIIESSTNKTGISINPKGGGQAHENKPPYYALCFIMKVAI